MMPAAATDAIDVAAEGNRLRGAAGSATRLLAAAHLLAALAVLLMCLAWVVPVWAAAAVELRAVQVRMTEDVTAGSGAEVVVALARAVSFDAGVQASPLRLEVLIPSARLASDWRAPQVDQDGGLLATAHVRQVSGGVLLSFGLRQPALIVDAHAERAAGGRNARLVVRLARTDAATLAKMLGVEEAALKRDGAAAEEVAGGKPAKVSADGQRQPLADAQERSPEALSRIKAAYRKLIEEVAAQPPAESGGIGDLIKALPLGYEEDSGEQSARAAAQRAQAAEKASATDKAPAVAHSAPDAKPAHGGAKPVIVVDAGHGGRDPGAIGVGGVKEKVIVLAFAKALRDALRKRGYRVVMTREGDDYLKLRERVAVARRHHAAMFVSIHADKFRSRRAGGLGIFTLSEEASDEDAAALAHMENAADLIGAPEDDIEDDTVRDILVELTQRETNANSHLLAQRLAHDLRKVAKLRRNPVRSAAFRVLRAPEIPSLLIELGFITNPRDVRNMRSPAWRRKVAARMAQTIDQVLKTRLALR